MVLNKNLRFSLNEILPLVESLPIEEKTEMLQRLLSKQSALDVNYLHSSVIGLISTMSRAELSDVLKAIGDRITSDGDICRK